MENTANRGVQTRRSADINSPKKDKQIQCEKGKRKNQSSGISQNQADSPRTENDGRQAQVKLGREQDGAKSNSKPPI